jgi:hypothetical protein
MNGWKAIIVCLLLPLIGCDTQTTTPRTQSPNLGRRDTGPVVLRSLQTMGGLDRLTTHAYLASATVTQYSPLEPPIVWQVQMRIDPALRTIAVHAPTGNGQWDAAAQGGNCTFTPQGRYQPTAQERMAICEMVQTVLHRVSGPLNFYVADEQARGTTRAIVDGEDVFRVGVTGGQAGIRAYYFDPATNLLHFATAVSDKPNQPGTVTMYQWQRIRGGIMFPQSIRVVNIGQHTLVGLQNVLEVDFDRVQSIEAPRKKAD